MKDTRDSVAWALLATLPLILIAGCFWYSAAPDFRKDNLKEVAVIWDRISTNDVVEKMAWTTTNPVQLAGLRDVLDTTSYESLSVLLKGDTTRIIVLTQGGDHWEMGLYGDEEARKLSMFNRIDPGKAGVIRKPGIFVKCLTDMIASNSQYQVDLSADVDSKRCELGLKRIVPDDVKKLMARFPEYK